MDDYLDESEHHQEQLETDMMEAEEEPDAEDVNLDPETIRQRVDLNKLPMDPRGQFSMPTNNSQVYVNDINFRLDNKGGSTTNYDANYIQSDLIEEGDFKNIEELTD